MAKRRYISDSFRSDPRIEELDPLERYLYLYLLTNQYVGVCGVYEIKMRRIAFETGIEKEMVTKMLARFQDAKKVFYIDGLILIVNFVKNQSIKTEKDNLRKGVEREIGELGSEKLDKILTLNDVRTTLQGAYKDVPIPYSTLLYSTLPNSTPLNKVPKKPASQYGNEDINNLIEVIKTACSKNGLIYSGKGAKERQACKRLLSKSFSERISEFGMNLETFVNKIVMVSTKLKYNTKQVTSARLIYYNREEIVNKAKMQQEYKGNTDSFVDLTPYLN